MIGVDVSCISKLEMRSVRATIWEAVACKAPRSGENMTLLVSAWWSSWVEERSLVVSGAKRTVAEVFWFSLETLCLFQRVPCSWIDVFGKIEVHK